MRTCSCKAKGRRLQQALAAAISTALRLPEEDVVSTSMGAQGADVCLSSAARLAFPFAVEAKNVERPVLSSAWKQAESHARDTTLFPMVCFAGNRKSSIAVVTLRGAAWLRLTPPTHCLVSSLYSALTRVRETGVSAGYNARCGEFILVPFAIVLLACVRRRHSVQPPPDCIAIDDV